MAIIRPLALIAGIADKAYVLRAIISFIPVMMFYDSSILCLVLFANLTFSVLRYP
ncbi:hypothetical protein Ngar_c27990 [Candidatus Nitrososphaera gargensis Ga9.2]|uniref:Uncharacterized protein n=1 Tax=Nitrososphaera gargensis (strain Ga9.2) TaxID=1237085 RepID=K0IIJ3_NITGG|nr:hypothetical protein Ngar_c27990 [Candidatus Nitrososphaera gargensis Ga9.2]